MTTCINTCNHELLIDWLTRLPCLLSVIMFIKGVISRIGIHGVACIVALGWARQVPVFKHMMKTVSVSFELDVKLIPKVFQVHICDLMIRFRPCQQLSVLKLFRKQICLFNVIVLYILLVPIIWSLEKKQSIWKAR